MPDDLVEAWWSVSCGTDPEILRAVERRATEGGMGLAGLHSHTR